MKMKSFIITFCSFPVILIFSCAKNKYPLQMIESKKAYSYLALGDSYTIGQSVMASENFPNQTVQLLNQQNYNFKSPEILATTGWTTDELQTNINNHVFAPPYDFVSL